MGHTSADHPAMLLQPDVRFPNSPIKQSAYEKLFNTLTTLRLRVVELEQELKTAKTQAENHTATIYVPENKIGIVTGPNGSKINLIQEKTGVTGIITNGEVFTIVGAQQAVEMSVSAIKELIQKGHCAFEDFKEEGVQMHPSSFPDIIGKQGVTIKAFKSELHVEVTIPEVPKNATQQEKMYKVTLAGKADDVLKAKEVLESIGKYGYHEITHPGQTHVEMEMEAWAYKYLTVNNGAELQSYQVKVKISQAFPMNVVIVGNAIEVSRAKEYIDNLLWKEPAGGLPWTVNNTFIHCDIDEDHPRRRTKSAPPDEQRGNPMLLGGLKRFEAQAGSAAEYDKAAAEKYKAEIDTRMKTLEDEAALLTGMDNKKECAAKGKEVAELKAEQRYADACKIVKGLEPKFGHFVTKAAVIPDAPIETKGEEDTKVASKKDSKETKKKSAGLSPAPVMAEIRGTTGMLSQAEQGLKLFEAQAGTAAEYDKAAAEKYKAEIDTRMKTLEDEVKAHPLLKSFKVRHCGVLGTADGERDPAPMAPVQAVVVDPAGFSFISRNNIRGAGGASGSIYKWLNLAALPGNGRFPQEVKRHFVASAEAEGRAKLHAYNSGQVVIHAVGPKLRDLTEGVEGLSQTYFNVFSEYCQAVLSEGKWRKGNSSGSKGSGKGGKGGKGKAPVPIPRVLRLPPISSGIFCENALLRPHMAEITWASISKALAMLPPERQELLKTVQLEVCIFQKRDVGVYQAVLDSKVKAENEGAMLLQLLKGGAKEESTRPAEGHITPSTASEEGAHSQRQAENEGAMLLQLLKGGAKEEGAHSQRQASASSGQELLRQLGGGAEAKAQKGNQWQGNPRVQGKNW